MSRITRSVSARVPAPAVPESVPAVPEPAPVVPAVPVVPAPAPAAHGPVLVVLEPAVDEPAPAVADYSSCNWLVSMRVSGGDDEVEIHNDNKGQLYITEHFIDTENKKQSAKTKVTPALLKKWLSLWFKSLRMDNHPKWTSVSVSFNLMPAIYTVRTDLSKDRAYDLIDHIRNAVDFHIALTAGNK